MLKRVVYVSIWEEGVIETYVNLNVETGEVLDIESSDEGSEYEFHIYSEIRVDGESFFVYEDERGLDYSIELSDLEKLK